jgi:hypothetical protein
LKKQNKQDNDNQRTESFQDNDQETGKYSRDEAQDENQSISDTSHVHTKAALLEPINKNEEKNVEDSISQEDGPKPQEDMLIQETSKPEACQSTQPDAQKIQAPPQKTRCSKDTSSPSKDTAEVEITCQCNQSSSRHNRGSKSFANGTLQEINS